MPLERASVRESNRDTQPLLSIVVAAYNIEGYIEEALESLLTQPLLDRMRIIVVDDGSTDDTFAAARSVVDRDGGAHIELLHQPNAGLSAARNTGLAAVRTPYVGFLDGDDIYLQGFSQAVIPLLEENDWDLLEYNVKIIDDDGKHLDDITLVANGASGGQKIGHAERCDFADKFHNFAWTRLYRTTLFEGLTFPPGRHYEDMAVVPQLFLRAKSIYRIPSPLIGYRRRFGSITQKAKLRDMRDLRTNGIEALARCDGGELDEYWLTVFDRLFQRARHVCARVDHRSFRQAAEVLSAMSADHRRACTALAARGGRKFEALSAFDFNLRADRSIFFLKGLVKKVLRRSLDHHARERRPAVSRQLSGSARGQ